MRGVSGIHVTVNTHLCNINVPAPRELNDHVPEMGGIHVTVNSHLCNIKVPTLRELIENAQRSWAYRWLSGDDGYARQHQIDDLSQD